MFHLAWFIGNGYGIQEGWKGQFPGTAATDWTKPGFYIDIARSLERACFDFVMMEDGLLVPDAYGASMDAYLRLPLECPRLDPVSMMDVLAGHTSHIGLVPTISTSFYPPFMAARSLATLDHLSDGRAGVNLVTTSSHRSANNFGLPRHYEHDLRYRMAGEWVSVVSQLLESWEEGALVQDPVKGVFADANKVHTIDFEGEFFKCRGPLNAPPGPQGRPVYCQAGSSSAGREFAARNADTLLCVPLGLEAMREFRQDMDRRLIANGRKPTDLKVLYLINPVVAETDEIAQDIYARRMAAKQSDLTLLNILAMMSYFTGIDFSQFKLDEPMPDLGTINGHQGSMDRFVKDGSKEKTLRELALGQDVIGSIDLVGSPATVARTMGEAMDYAGGDGFMFACPLDRRVMATIADGLVPELQSRNLVRSRYEHAYFRDNLLAF